VKALQDSAKRKRPGPKRKYKTNADRQRAYRKRLKRYLHFRSNKHTWETPPETFDPLHAEFGFTIDVCALPHNAKLPRFYTPDQDGLQQDWSEEVVWCNPPYGREIGKWMRKAVEAWQAGATVVCLVPGRRGPLWWRAYVKPYATEIRDLEKRLRFVGAPAHASFDSAVVIYRPMRH
jgi:phage N-6-adenine-methyltransferase